MKLNTAQKIWNLILLTLFISQAASGLFSTKISFDTFKLVHKDGGLILIVAVMIHLILNFRWIKASYFRQ